MIIFAKVVNNIFVPEVFYHWGLPNFKYKAFHVRVKI